LRVSALFEPELEAFGAAAGGEVKSFPAMGYSHLRIARDGAVATVSVCRPDKLNALSDATLEELLDAFTGLAADEAVRCAILTGGEAKRPAFVAGADIAELAQQDPLAARRRSRLGQGVCERIENLGKPVIAAVNGFALGGGLELALACHIRLASTDARLGLPEVTLGIIPGYGGTQRLPRLIGLGAALELITTGRMVEAEEARALGLVNRVVPPGELLGAAKELASKISANGPIAVRLALEAALRGASAPLEEGLACEQDLFGVVSATADMREGLKAFLEKRPAQFRNA
jgi:enoyl-CoA hydratase